MIQPWERLREVLYGGSSGVGTCVDSSGKVFRVHIAVELYGDIVFVHFSPEDAREAANSLLEGASQAEEYQKAAAGITRARKHHDPTWKGVTEHESEVVGDTWARPQDQEGESAPDPRQDLTRAVNSRRVRANYSPPNSGDSDPDDHDEEWAEAWAREQEMAPIDWEEEEEEFDDEDDPHHDWEPAPPPKRKGKGNERQQVPRTHG